MAHRLAWTSLGMLLLGACSPGGSPTAPAIPESSPEAAPAPDQPRTYAMGWAPVAPRNEQSLVVAVMDSIAKVSDLAIMQQPVPWAQLLAGVPMDTLVQERVRIAAHLRSLGMDIIFLVDPLDPWDRRKETPALVAAGRSIEEPSIRAMHEEWVRQIAKQVHPEWFGLASEINTLAARGDPTLYASVRDMVNDLAPQVRQVSPGSGVFVSFQADEANGRFGPESIDNFALIGDFDIDALGLSSYPVFFFDDPADIPSDYFRRFDDATDLPLLLVEGGWSSANVPMSAGSPDQQVAFLNRFEELLDGVDARAWVMLTFTDLDVAANFGSDPARVEGPSNFAHMGILDTELRRKPAYATWQRIFGRPLAR